MASNLNYKQVTNVVRRKWDVEAYEKRAQERLKNEADGGGGSSKNKRAPNASGEGPTGGKIDDDDADHEEFVPATAAANKAHRSQRAYLKARSNKVDSLDSKIGSVEIINPDAAATVRSQVAEASGIDKDTAVTKSGVGWHCRVCDCFLRDSHAYLDHINGRKHQRNLGYSMRVERSTKDQVADRLAALVKQKEKSKKESEFDEPQEEEMYNDMVKAKDKELKKKQEERKRERKERRKKKKEEQKNETKPTTAEDTTEAGSAQEANGEEDEAGGIDPNLAAMMGFSGFGGGANGR